MNAKRDAWYWIALEDLFILVSILAIWPVILGWEGWAWEVVKLVAVAGLIWILLRRVRRYRERGASESDPGRMNPN